MHLKNSHIYWCLAVLRVALVFAPQTGYIHPDEFFQSLEVFTGKIFEVSARLPWEFKVTFPIRSVALAYSTVGAGLKLLKGVDYLARVGLNSSVVTPYALIVVPRLLMCCFSFVVDYCLYKICANNNEKYSAKLLVLASSYVMVIYGTRTLSNTFELVLFAVLLYYVAESLTFSNTVIKKREYINMRYRQSRNAVDRVKWNKLSTYLKPDSLRNCFLISTVTVLGFFNRPTFLAFAVGPVFFWLYRGIGCKSVATLQFHLRSFVLLLCAVPSIVLIIAVDSFYYGYISWGEIGVGDVTINSFVFTPLNFIKYNTDTNNLREHGLHPRWLHLLVNIPLLFNVLGAVGAVGIATFVYRFARSQYSLLPTVRSIKGLMMLSASIPVAVLSLFPHQEPRFLIPILFPLVYLYSSSLLEEPEGAVVKAHEKSKRKSRAAVHETYNTSSLFKLWLVLNVLFAAFYGFVHQGGVFPMVSYLSKELKDQPATTKLHVFTSHVYSFPESFLLQPDPNKVFARNRTKYNVNRRYFMYEEGSNDLELVLRKITITVSLLEVEAETKKLGKNKFYFVLPSSMENHLQFLLNEKEYETINADKITTLYPHISVEGLPNFTSYCLDLLPFGKNCKDGNSLSWYEYISNAASLCGLDLYEISII